MKGVFKTSLMSALLLALVSLGMAEANADPVTFSTSGTFTCAGCSGSGTNSSHGRQRQLRGDFQWDFQRK
jgi:hypothetical protein